MRKVYFAENLKSLRHNAGMTQKKLADVVGVDQRTVSAWETGVCEPDFATLARLCEFFDEDFNGILG